MICRYCGGEIEDSSMFCTYCGKRVEDPTEPMESPDSIEYPENSEKDTEALNWQRAEKSPIIPGILGGKGILIAGGFGLILIIGIILILFMAIRAGSDIAEELSEEAPSVPFQQEEGAERDREELHSVTYRKEMNQDGILITDRITYEAVGDKVQRLLEWLEVDMYEFDDEMKDVMVEIYDEMMDTYNSIEGVEAVATKENDVYLVSLTIDTTIASGSELTDAGLLWIQGDGEDISLEESAALLEKQGYEKIEESKSF